MSTLDTLSPALEALRDIEHQAADQGLPFHGQVPPELA